MDGSRLGWQVPEVLNTLCVGLQTYHESVFAHSTSYLADFIGTNPKTTNHLQDVCMACTRCATVVRSIPTLALVFFLVQTLASWQSPLTKRYLRDVPESGIRAVLSHTSPILPSLEKPPKLTRFNHKYFLQSRQHKTLRNKMYRERPPTATRGHTWDSKAEGKDAAHYLRHRV